MPHNDVLGFGLTILLLLIGIFLGRADIAALRGEMNNLRGEMNNLRGEMNNLRGEMNSRFNALDARIDRIFTELGTFHSIQGEHKAKIEALERKQGL